jgi:hypothetical protein
MWLAWIGTRRAIQPSDVTAVCRHEPSSTHET